MTRRLFLGGAVALVCARVVMGPADSLHWLSALTLAVADAGLTWRVAAAWVVSAAAVGAGLLSVGRGAAPGWLWGAWGGALLTAWIVTMRVGGFRREGTRWEEALQEAEGQQSSVEERQRNREKALQEKEASIQEMSGMYQLSKRFLGTLDTEEGLRITRDFLAKAFPFLEESELEGHLSRVRGMVDRAEVSAEALIQAIPLRGTDYSHRERWSVLSNQLALGLQRISLYQQVQESATHDGLTGLMVRRHLQERLDGEVEAAERRGGSLAFLMVDLDRFKGVNDTYGHLVGDVVLREIARIIKGSVREMDLVGRYGGEEFGVALPDADERMGLHIAERIRSAVESAPIRAYDEEIRITVSVGLALYPRHADAAERLVEQADRAMYRAKGLGRNRTVLAGKEGPT